MKKAHMGFSKIVIFLVCTNLLLSCLLSNVILNTNNLSSRLNVNVSFNDNFELLSESKMIDSPSKTKINDLAMPILLGPTSGAILTSNTPVLSWVKPVGAFWSRVVVDDDPTFSSPEISSFVYEDYLNCIPLADNVYYWKVSGTDLFGSTGPWSDSSIFTIDTTPPERPELISPVNGIVINNNTPTLICSENSDYYHYQFTIDNDPKCYYYVDFGGRHYPLWSEYTSDNNHTFPPLADGTYWWSVRARDFAGNWCPWQIPYSFTVDTTPPDNTNLTSPDSGLVTQDTSVNLEWSEVSDATSYKLVITQNPMMIWPILTTYLTTTEYSTPILPDGNYYWQVTAIDSAGNNASGSEVRLFIIDTTPPNTPNLYFPSNNSKINSANPYLSWQGLSDTSYYQIQIDDTPKFDSPIATINTGHTYFYPTLGDGTYYWHVRAIDSVGNIGEWSYNWTFTIDTTPPDQITIKSPNDGIIQNNATIKLEWYSVADAVYYLLQIDNDSDFGSYTEYNLTTTDYTLSSLDDDQYYYRVRAYDEIGNIGEWSIVRTFFIDTLAPEITDIHHTPSDPNDLDFISVYCNVTDMTNLSSLKLFYRIDGGDWLNVSMIDTTGNQYKADIGKFSYNKFIEYYIVANDTSFEMNCAVANNSGLFYNFTIVSFDIDCPALISVVQSPHPANDLHIVNITAFVTDCSGVDYVDIYYRVNGGSWSSFNMTNTIGTSYFYSLGSFNYEDFIEYYFYTIDTSPNRNDAIHDNFGAYYTFSIGASDFTGPLIENITHSPTKPTEINPVTINCTVVDTNDIHNVTLSYQINGGTWINVSMINYAENNYSITIGTFSISDEIEYFISAFDNYATHNYATNNNSNAYYKFTVFPSDNSGPSITNIQRHPFAPMDNNTVIVDCSVEDPNGVYSVLFVNRVNGGIWNITNMDNTTGNIYEMNLGQFNYSDYVEYFIIATDNHTLHNFAVADNNTNYFSFFTTCSDFDAPEITDVIHQPENPETNDFVFINCTLTDLWNISSVYVYFRIHGSSWGSKELEWYDYNKYYTRLGLFSDDDFVEYYIYAIDASPNSNIGINNNSGIFYNFVIRDFDHFPPSIIMVEHQPESTHEGDSVTITCAVNDIGEGIKYATVFYRVNSGSWFYENMTQGSAFGFEGDIGSFLDGDIIEYYIFAKDLSDHANFAINDNDGSYYTITVTSSDVVAPSISEVSHYPEFPAVDDDIFVEAQIIDTSGLSSATLYYRINGDSWQSASMEPSYSNFYNGVIGILEVGDFVEYYVVAVDDTSNFNTATDDNDGDYYAFSIGSATGGGTISIIIPLISTLSVIAVIRKKRK